MATLPTPIKSKSNQANATTPATGTHSTSVAQAHASISINNEDFPFLDKNDLKDIENARNLSGGNKSNGNGSENVNSNGEAINLGNVDTKAIQAQLQKANVMQVILSLKSNSKYEFKGLYLYIVGVLFYVE